MGTTVGAVLFLKAFGQEVKMLGKRVTQSVIGVGCRISLGGTLKEEKDNLGAWTFFLEGERGRAYHVHCLFFLWVGEGVHLTDYLTDAQGEKFQPG